MTGFRVYKREGRLKMPTKESFGTYAAARKFAYAWADEQRRQGYRTGQIVIQGPLVFGEEVLWLGESPQHSPSRVPRGTRPSHAPRKTPAQLSRDVAKVLKKPAMTVKRADEVIQRANLGGFGGECGRVAIAINRVMFNDKGRYVIATNPAINAHRGTPFMGHVVVEWKGRLFDATGLIDDEDKVESWGMVDHTDTDYAYLTEDEANNSQLHYIDDLFRTRTAQEAAIQAGTRGRCPLHDVERSLQEAMA